MATTAKWYGNAFKAAFNKEIDWNDGNVKVALCTSSYTPDQDTHDYFDDITNELTTAGGYTAGGAALANPTLTYTGATNVFKLDADDTAWSSATFTCRNAIVYYNTGTASTSPLICYQTFDADQSPSAGTFTVQWNTDGIVKATPA
jgi:hypothetical protein